MDVNVLGAGVMGQQISAILLLMGHDVHLWSPHLDETAEKRIRVHMKLAQRVWPDIGRCKAGRIRFVAGD